MTSNVLRTSPAKLFCAVIACMSMLATGAMAQATKPTAAAKKPRSGWRVQCGDTGHGLQCKVLQSIAMRRTRQRLATVSVQRNQNSKSPAILYQLPHGIFLPDGVRISIDKAKAKTLVFQTCDRQGCYAGAALSGAELGQMSNGKVLSITFKNLAKKTIALRMSLAGFRQAFDKLK